jgi:hypothetical protein
MRKPKYYVLLTYDNSVTINELFTSNKARIKPWVKENSDHIKEDMNVEVFDIIEYDGIPEHTKVEEKNSWKEVYYRFEPRIRHNTVDGSTWWYPWDKEEHKWSSLTCHNKQHSKQSCMFIIKTYKDKGWY